MEIVFIEVIPNAMTGVLMRQGNLEQLCTKRTQCKDIGRRWSFISQGERHRTDLPSWISEGTNPDHTLISDYWSPELQGNVGTLLFQS
jgi:hypothetical protein